MCKYNSVPENAKNNLLLLNPGRITEAYVGYVLRTETRWQAVAILDKASVIWVLVFFQ